MKLYIAEKPSLGRAIIDALPKPHHKKDGYVLVGHHDQNQCDAVSWCVGHILEQAEPEAYRPEFKKWSLTDLPIMPDDYDQGWQLKPKKQTRKQFSVLKKLIKQASHIIHCGDPDREGQLLIDEVIHHVGVKEAVRNAIERCLISDLNRPAVVSALANLKPNSVFIPLSVSALARSRADWLYGINMTRCCSLHGQKNGFRGVLSVGRVQTPILGLVVRRDLEIEQFSPQAYYEVNALIALPDNQKMRARWQPSNACSPYQDEEGRILSQALAENVIKRIQGKPAVLSALSTKQKKQSAPLPYNLSALQIDAAKQFGFTAKVVLDTCQSLYEQHKLITYPRSDNRYLPQAHFKQAPQIISAISEDASLVPLCQEAQPHLKSKAWNDAKVGAHHAIIPSAKKPQTSKLSHVELKVYQLIAKQYLAQFYSPWLYQDSRAEFTIAGGLFVAKERLTLSQGWKRVFTTNLQDNALENDSANKDHSTSAFQLLKKDTHYHCEKGELLSKQTQAPKHFTDASLLAAMTGIARFVKNPEIKNILKETDGLGTEATRANIIELLFKRQFLERQGKQIKASAAGKSFITALPEAISAPDMTAHWESKLTGISTQAYRYNDFMAPLKQTICDYINNLNSTTFSTLQNVARPKRFKKRKRKAVCSG